jgi:DNA-binding transcriptional MerR regulator
MPMYADTPLLLTRKETATLLRRCSRTVRQYEKRGLLHPVRFADGRPLYRAEDVEALINRGRS